MKQCENLLTTFRLKHRVVFAMEPEIFDLDDSEATPPSYYLECGPFECQRWLEEVTKEQFLYDDDFPRSLLEGHQLRKLINLLRPNIFTFDPFDDTTEKIFKRAKIYFENYLLINDDDWISQFIVICDNCLRIFPKYIFHWSDIDPENGIQDPENFQQIICRICVTIVKLSDLYLKKNVQVKLQSSHLFDPEFRDALLVIHRRFDNVKTIVIRKNKSCSIQKRTDYMLIRYLHGLSTSNESSDNKFSENQMPINPPSDDLSSIKPVITARHVKAYTESTVPQPFVQPVNQFSTLMAAQAVEQAMISKKQNEELKMLKSTVKIEHDSFNDVQKWRNTRRKVSNQMTDKTPISAPAVPEIQTRRPLHVDPCKIPLIPRKKDTQEQIIIASPKQRNEGSQDSGLENSTPEVSPPGAQTRTHWRTESASSGSSFIDKLAVESPSKSDPMTQPKFISSKRAVAPSPPVSEVPVIKSFSSLSVQKLSPELESVPVPRFTERNASANFLCRKDHSEAALCKAIVAQGAMDEAFGTFKAAPSHKNGKYSSVRIEIEATRENHAKVAAVKTVAAKETMRASGHFKPMCELIDENNQRRHSPYSGESSISPASSSRSSDFGGDNGSIDRMSFASSNAGGDYKVVALDAKPQPGKLTEFVPEVERSKKTDAYLVSSLGSNSSPPPDTAVVRNWELSDEEQQMTPTKIYSNNNDRRKNINDPESIEEVKHEPAYLDRKWVRSQGYPTPFDVNSKNLVDADSRFRILPKDENRSRPLITKIQKAEMPPTALTNTRKVFSDSRHPSGAPQHRPDLFSEEQKLAEKPQTLLTVSGKLRCGHCACELGRGSAMIIEALGLFYHINCFRCHVCDKALGSGNQTTDVRVRDGKLHCEKCYSNEDIGVKLSEI